MKVIVQRVSSASVSVAGKIVSSIEKGYLLLVGFKLDDTIDQVKYIARKIANLRIFSDKDGKMNLSINQINGEILSISQFTVYGDTTNSNRPSFTSALDFKKADDLYKEFNKILTSQYSLKVKTGVFGEHMKVDLTNDGPVTIIIERNYQ